MISTKYTSGVCQRLENKIDVLEHDVSITILEFSL